MVLTWFLNNKEEITKRRGRKREIQVEGRKEVICVNKS
jgi:hypothetical protein